jgi:hypothetical protein
MASFPVNPGWEANMSTLPLFPFFPAASAGIFESNKIQKV